MEAFELNKVKEFITQEFIEHLSQANWVVKDESYGLWIEKEAGEAKDTHASSADFDYDWGDLDAGDKSFLDAVWIKSYNGNSNGYYYQLITPSRPSDKPEWELRRTNSHNHNYVDAVSRREE